MNAIPCEANSSSRAFPAFRYPFRSRSNTDWENTRSAYRVPKCSEAMVSSSRTDVQDFYGSILDPLSHPSQGDVEGLLCLRRKIQVQEIAIQPGWSTGDGAPETETGPSSAASAPSAPPARRSNSTAEAPRIFLADPAVNRLQVSPAAVESLRAKMLRQRRDLAPRWAKGSTHPSSADQRDPGGTSSPEGSMKKLGRQNPTPEATSYHDPENRSSLLPFPTSRNSEFASSSDVRPKSAARGISDFFRLRMKSQSCESSSSPPLGCSDSSEDRTKSQNPNSRKALLPLAFRRPRSKSTVDPPRYLELQKDLEGQGRPSNSSEPISVRVFDLRKEPRGRDAPSSPGQPLGGDGGSTPMGELLTRQVSSRSGFGIMDFLELYKNHTAVSDSKPEEMSLQSGISDVEQPSADKFASDEGTYQLVSPVNAPSRTWASLQPDLPESIPEYDEVPQVRLPETRQRRRHATPTSVRQFVGGEEPAKSRSRRFSEPSKPNLQIRPTNMNLLSSIRVKLVSNTATGEDTNGVVKNVSRLSEVARSFGIQIPMTLRHRLLLWKDKDNEAQLLKLPVNCNDSYNLGSDDNLTFVKLMKQHKCHDLMPQSAMLVLLDSDLKVISAFYALMFNGVRSAPIWESARRDFIGMLTVTDFIKVLRMFYKSPEEIGDLEDHKISDWMNLLKGQKQSIITVDPDDNLFDALIKLTSGKVHRILVADSVSGDGLYVLSYKKIIQLIYILMFEEQMPSFMDRSIDELDIGTFGDAVFTVSTSTHLIDALDLLVEKRVSALPVVDVDGHVINIYAKVDAINLAMNQSYKNLDCTIEEVLKIQRERFEGVFTCKRTDSLRHVTQSMIQENIHRMIVTDENSSLIGIVSLSDIVRFIVIKQFHDSTDFDVQPGDVNAEMDLTL